MIKKILNSKKKYQFSLLTHISLFIILLSLILSNVYIFIEMIGCTGWGCMIGMCYIVTIPAAILFAIFYWLAQRFFWCLLVFSLMIIGMTGFSIFLFIDPSTDDNIRFWFLLVFVCGLFAIISQVIYWKKICKIKKKIIKFTPLIFIIVSILGYYAYCFIYNPSGHTGMDLDKIKSFYLVFSAFFLILGAVKFFKKTQRNIFLLSALLGFLLVFNVRVFEKSCILVSEYESWIKNCLRKGKGERASILNFFNKESSGFLTKEQTERDCLTVENFNLIRDFILENGDITMHENHSYYNYEFDDLDVSTESVINFDVIRIKKSLYSYEVRLNKKNKELKIFFLNRGFPEDVNTKGYEYFCEIVEKIKSEKLGNQIISKEKAFEYARAWSVDINSDFSNFTKISENIFYGKLGSIIFEYNDLEKKLIVRSVVDQKGNKYIEREKYLTELVNIAKREPERAAGGFFELLLLHGQKEPSLNIRMDFTDQKLSNEEFLKIAHRLSNTAFSWKGDPLVKVILDVNKRFYAEEIEAEKNQPIKVSFYKDNSEYPLGEHVIEASKGECIIKFYINKDHIDIRRFNCLKRFSDTKEMYRLILNKLYEKYDIKDFTGFTQGSLMSVDYNWCLPIAVISHDLPDYLDYKTNYPNSKITSLNDLFVKIANDELVYQELNQLFNKFGLEIRISAAEKISTKKAKNLPFKDFLGDSNERVLYDAGLIHFEIKPKQTPKLAQELLKSTPKEYQIKENDKLLIYQGGKVSGNLKTNNCDSTKKTMCAEHFFVEIDYPKKFRLDIGSGYDLKIDKKYRQYIDKRVCLNIGMVKEISEKYQVSEKVEIIDCDFLKDKKSESKKSIISSIREKYYAINKNINKYRKEEKDAPGKSTEGGQATFYFDGENLKKISATYYGETGKKLSDFYYDEEELFFVFKQTIKYNRPIYMDEERLAEMYADIGEIPEDMKEFREEVESEERYYFHENELIKAIFSSEENEEKFKKDSETLKEKGKEVLEEIEGLKLILKK